MSGRSAITAIAFALAALAIFVAVSIGRQPASAPDAGTSPDAASSHAEVKGGVVVAGPGGIQPLLFASSPRGLGGAWCILDATVAQAGFQVQAPFQGSVQGAAPAGLSGTALRRSAGAKDVALYVAGDGGLQACPAGAYRAALVGLAPDGSFALARPELQRLKLASPSPLDGSTSAGDAFSGIALRDPSSHAVWAYLGGQVRVVGSVGSLAPSRAR